MRDRLARVESARWLLNHQPFVSVEKYGDEWSGPNSANFVVGLHSIAGHDFPDLLEGTVKMLLERPGVNDVLNEDAEVIHVWATTLDPNAVTEDLRGWWQEHLEPIAETDA
jgi:hypothetical protein